MYSNIMADCHRLLVNYATNTNVILKPVEQVKESVDQIRKEKLSNFPPCDELTLAMNDLIINCLGDVANSNPDSYIVKEIQSPSDLDEIYKTIKQVIACNPDRQFTIVAPNRSCDIVESDELQPHKDKIHLVNLGKSSPKSIYVLVGDDHAVAMHYGGWTICGDVEAVPKIHFEINTGKVIEIRSRYLLAPLGADFEGGDF